VADKASVTASLLTAGDHWWSRLVAEVFSSCKRRHD
jgi:hypothetical protein